MGISSTLAKMAEPVTSGFVLMKLEGSDLTPVYGPDGQLLKFASGDEAASRATALSRELGVKVQPRRMADKDWRAREQKKMDDGTYRKLPWADTDWWGELAKLHRDHFPHVALGTEARIAYTENEEKGSADIQTVIRPGKYLERYFPEKLTKFVVRDLCTIMAKTFETNEIQFTSDPDIMEEVFINGPNSCMTKETENYKTGGTHPVRMYAAGDLEIAYLRRKGKIVARSVTWPANKIYNTIYGDRALMEPMLKKLDMKPGCPTGARLIKMANGSGKVRALICPHVDNSAGVVVDGEFLKVTNKAGDKVIQVPGGGGLTEPVGYSCDACKKEDMTQRHIVSLITDKVGKVSATRCKECAKKTTCICAVTGTCVDINVATAVNNGRALVWQQAIDNKHGVGKCDGNGEYYTRDRLVSLNNGKQWSLDYWEKNGGYCAACGARSPRDYKCDGKKNCVNANRFAVHYSEAGYR